MSNPIKFALIYKNKYMYDGFAVIEKMMEPIS